MKTLFDADTRAELIRRVHLLNEQTNPAWGKMNAYQMVKHNIIWNDWVLGKRDFYVPTRVFG